MPWAHGDPTSVIPFHEADLSSESQGGEKGYS